MWMIADNRFALSGDPDKLADDQRILVWGPYCTLMLKSDDVNNDGRG